MDRDNYATALRPPSAPKQTWGGAIVRIKGNVDSELDRAEERFELWFPARV